MHPEARHYAAIAVLYVASRLALSAIGVPFEVSYDWVFMHDLAWLESRPLETLWYTHAFPPLMNAWTALVHAVSDRYAHAIHHVAFVALGTALALCFARLGRDLGLRWAVVHPMVGLFVLTPAYLYLEHLFLHTFPSAALLLVACAAFAHALHSRRFASWLLFFGLCAGLTLLRASFHLIWLIAMVVAAVLADRTQWRTIARAAVLPTGLAMGWYAKNLILFGFFGASSWLGFNTAKVTTQQLPPAERQAWVQDGRLHPVSALRLYGGPEGFKPHFDTRRTGAVVLDAPRRSQGLPNFNHLAYVEASRLRLRGNLVYLQRRPSSYAQTVLRGIIDYAKPTPRWHPKDPEGSPHRAHRAILGGWENIYTTVVHGFPNPVGLYVLAPWVVVGVVVRALRRRRTPGAKIVLLLAFQILYVTTVSCVLEIGELERYRFVIEAPLWLVAMWGIQELIPRMRTSKPPAGAAS